MKIVQFVDFYKNEIDYYKKTVDDILMKEIPLILPNFPKNEKRRERYKYFIRLAYIGISSYLQSKRQTTLKKAFIAMENEVNVERNKIFLRRFSGNVQHL